MSGMSRGFIVALDMPLICFSHAAHLFFIARRKKMSDILSRFFLLFNMPPFFLYMLLDKNPKDTSTQASEPVLFL